MSDRELCPVCCDTGQGPSCGYCGNTGYLRPRLGQRELLAAALDKLPAISGTATDRHSIPADRLLILVRAARERLAQLEAADQVGEVE